MVSLKVNCTTPSVRVLVFLIFILNWIYIIRSKNNEHGLLQNNINILMFNLNILIRVYTLAVPFFPFPVQIAPLSFVSSPGSVFFLFIKILRITFLLSLRLGWNIRSSQRFFGRKWSELARWKISLRKLSWITSSSNTIFVFDLAVKTSLTSSGPKFISWNIRQWTNWFLFAFLLRK